MKKRTEREREGEREFLYLMMAWDLIGEVEKRSDAKMRGLCERSEPLEVGSRWENGGAK